MKSVVNMTPPSIGEYPCLRAITKHTYGNDPEVQVVVLFVSEKEGTIVSGSLQGGRGVGYHSKEWSPAIFTPFKGSVTLVD